MVTTSNPMLQRIFDEIVRANLKNVERMKDGRKVLVEGDIWRGIWLETQPMGGAMYGKFDLDIARNNIEVVMDGQLGSGLLPHMTNLDGSKWYGTGIPGYAFIGFNAVAKEMTYTQAWQGNEYKLVNSCGRVSGFTNGKKTFEVPSGLRVETDYAGNVSIIAGLSPVSVAGALALGKLNVKSFAAEPNQVYSVAKGRLCH